MRWYLFRKLVHIKCFVNLVPWTLAGRTLCEICVDPILLVAAGQMRRRFFLTIMMPMTMVTKCPISKNGVKSDSQVLSPISLCICLIRYSEANSRNNWMRGEQACRGEVALSKRTETNISVRKNTPTIIIKKTDHLIIWSSDHLITWSSSWSPDSEPLVLCSRPRSSGRPLPQCAV